MSQTEFNDNLESQCATITGMSQSIGKAVNVEPTSPAPSVDRLSVTFAMDEPEKVDGDIEKTEEILVKNEQTKGRTHLKFDF